MKKFLSVVVVIVALAAGIGYWFGMFEPLEFTETEMWEMPVLYKTHVGDYTQVGKIYDEMYVEFEENSIEMWVGFGVYLDDPQKVPKEELKSALGSVYSGGVLTGSAIPAWWIHKITKEHKAVTVTFPYKNKMSFMLGVMKVYPAIKKYVEENDYPMVAVMEVYDYDKITFVLVQDVNFLQDFSF